MERTDGDGEFWDLIFDVVSVVTSVVEVIKNPDDPWAWAGLVGDIVDVAVPFVGGVGEVTKAAGAVSKTADLVDAAHDATKAVGAVQDVGKAAKKVDLHKSYEWKKIRSNYWKEQAKIGGNDTWYKINDRNLNRMKKGQAPIGYDNEKVVLHHVRGIANDMNDFVEIGGGAHTVRSIRHMAIKVILIFI